MNKQLTNLLSGYQDLMDRYGTDDPLVQQMKDEIDHRQSQLGRLPPELRWPTTIRDSEWRTQQPPRVAQRA